MWNLKSIYENDSRWEEQIKLTNIELSELKLPQNSEENLIDILDLLNVWYEKIDELYTYGLLRRDQDMRNSEIDVQLQKIHELYSKYGVKTKSLQKYIDSMGKKIIIKLEKENSSEYLPYFKKKYELNNNKYDNDKEDMLLQLNSRIVPNDRYLEWYYSHQVIGKFNYKEKSYNVTNFNLLEYLKNSDRKFRMLTYRSCEEFFQSVSDITSNLLNTHFQIQNQLSKVRGFPSIYNMYLNNDVLYSRNKDILTSIYPDMKNLNHSMLLYKRNTIDQETITYSDLYYLPGENEYKFDQKKASKIVVEAFKMISPEFSKLARKVFDENWIDWFSREGKHPGQRSISSYKTHPFISLTWSNGIDDMFDLAHEVAGAISQYLASKNGSFIYSELSILKTEYMSAVGALALAKYLLKDSGNNIQEKVVKEKVIDFIKDTFLSTYQISMIESKLAEKSSNSSLYASDISKIWYDFVRDYNDTDFFDDMPINRNNWVKHDHLFLKGYDFKYVETFIFAINYLFKTNLHCDLVELLKMGERISDNKFIESIFGMDWNDREVVNFAISKISSYFMGDKIE